MVARRSERRSARPGDSTTGVAFSPDRRWLLAGRLDGGAIVYDAATHRPVRRVEVGSVVSGVAFHPDGNLFAVSTIDGKVRLFDRRTGSPSRPPTRRARHGGLAGRLQPGRPAAGGGRRPERRRRCVLRAEARRRGEGLGRGIAPSRGAGDRCPVAGRCSPSRSTRRTLLATASYRGQLDLGRGHARPPRRADARGRTASRASHSIRAAGSSRPVAPPARCVWRAADQRAAYPPLAGPGGVSGAAFDPTARCSPTTLHGGTRLWDARPASATATSWPRGEADRSSPWSTSRSSGSETRSAPTAEVLATSGVDAPRDALARGSGGLAPSSVRDRGSQPHAAGVAAPPPVGKPYRATCPGWPTD